MRSVHLSVLLIALLASTGQPAAQESVREIRVISAGVVYNAGLLDLAAAFGKENRF